MEEKGEIGAKREKVVRREMSVVEREKERKSS